MTESSTPAPVTSATDNLPPLDPETGPVEREAPEHYLNRELSWIEFNARRLTRGTGRSHTIVGTVEISGDFLQ